MHNLLVLQHHGQQLLLLISNAVGATGEMQMQLISKTPLSSNGIPLNWFLGAPKRKVFKYGLLVHIIFRRNLTDRIRIYQVMQ